MGYRTFLTLEMIVWEITLSDGRERDERKRTKTSVETDFSCWGRKEETGPQEVSEDSCRKKVSQKGLWDSVLISEGEVSR